MKSMQNCSICAAKLNEMSDIRNLNNFKRCEGTLFMACHHFRLGSGFLTA